MPDTNIIGHLIIYMVVLLLAISAHEAAHAWMSLRYGDDTAYHLGRVTLNPVAHIDPVGTLLIPVINFITMSLGLFIPLIGWGKPTPVNPLRWRDKDRANIMVSLAGIMANTLIAVIALVVIKVLQAAGVFNDGGLYSQFRSLSAGMPNETMAEPVALILMMAVTMNASLAIFNLLPFPPLDGSKVLYSVLPASAQPALEALEQYGFIILIVAVYLGVVGIIFAPVRLVIEYLIKL